MARDEMSVLHLKRMKVLEVMVDDPFEFKVLVADTRPVVLNAALAEDARRV